MVDRGEICADVVRPHIVQRMINTANGIEKSDSIILNDAMMGWNVQHEWTELYFSDFRVEKTKIEWRPLLILEISQSENFGRPHRE